MKTINTFLIAIFMIAACNLTAQVAINTDGSSADGSAMLDVKSTSSGFLPPRMTAAQRDAIASPGEGLIVWCTDCGNNGEMQVYNGTVWRNARHCGDDIIDNRDGNTYKIVQIGAQCWMAENLNYDQSAYGNDWCYDDNSTNCNTYGRLYDWDAVMQGAPSSNSNPSGVQGVCPDGWHIPSDAEWTTLTAFLGGISVAGDKMKEEGTAHWISPNTGATNSSGFTALPGGVRYNYPGWYGLTIYAAWWSSTESPPGDDAWFLSMNSDYEGVFETSYPKGYGFSVRCLRD